jgi:hypothetical protein
MSKDIREFLAGYTAAVQKLALKVRKLVLDIMPQARQYVDEKSKLIGYSMGEKMSDLVFVIMPLKSAVNLGVYRGAELPDPGKLLEGTGKLHRHVRIQSEADLKSPALRALLEAAVTKRKSDKQGKPQ